MKQYNFLLIFQFIFSSLLIAQDIPKSHQVNWKNAGIIPPHNISNTINIMSFGATGDGSEDESDAFRSAIKSLNGDPGIIYLPPGKYLFKNSINLPSNTILRGASSDSTFLIFDLGESTGHCINVVNDQKNKFYPITNKTLDGEFYVSTSSYGEFKKGNYVEIRMKNGSWDSKPANWAAYSVGHISFIEKIEDEKIKLKDALRFNIKMDLEPEMRIIEPVTNVGLEYFTISRLNKPTTGGPYNMYFGYANTSWIKGVESAKSVGSHVMIESSYAVNVSGSYFHEAFEYDGSATHGYGLTLIQHSSNCLIENNVFKTLRHAMMVKQGANGNVFAYNYAYDPKREEFPYDAGGDISCHGHYPLANLFEGNLVQTIHIDQAWGPNGPKNTFFRNRAALYGVILTSGTVDSDEQVFIGNEVTNTTFLKGNYTINGTNHFEHGNLVKGTVKPENTNSLKQNSLYLEEKPAFWYGSLKWPSIGLSTNELVDLPAYERVKKNSKVTVGPESDITNIENTFNNINYFKIKYLTRSFKQIITMEIEASSSQKIEIALKTIGGQMVFQNSMELGIGINTIALDKNLTHLKAGWYLLTINNNHQKHTSKIIKIK